MRISTENPYKDLMDTSTKVTYSASGLTALWGFFTVEQWIGIAGILIGLSGLAIRTYFEMREEKRRMKRHELEMLRLEQNIEAVEQEVKDLET